MSRASDAAHEAGHAVVALLLGLEVRSATIVGGPWQSSSSVELADPEAGTAEHRCMVRLAGRQALVAFGDLEVPTAELGCRRDELEAHAYAVEIASGDQAQARQVLGELRRQVDDILLEHRNELGRVCIALLERGTLSANELDEIAAAGTVSSFRR